MKYVEFSAGDEGDADTVGLSLQLPDPNAEKANQKQGQSLEHLLMAKNKRILDELAKFRVRLQISWISVASEIAETKRIGSTRRPRNFITGGQLFIRG